MAKTTQRGARKAPAARAVRPQTKNLGRQLTQLKSQVGSARAEAEHRQDEVAGMRQKLDASRRQQSALKRRVEEIEAENRRLCDRFVLLEEQATKLSFLYSASHQLLQTLDRQELIASICETVINIVGSEDYALYETDPASGELRQISSMGSEASRARVLRPGEGPLGKLIGAGLMELNTAGDPERPAAVVPLRQEGKLAGALVVFRLLPHKAAFEPVDREILRLLGEHAARALYCARLHERVARAAEVRA